ncbi:MAG: alkyl sulfatase dimerization domain-containing protein [Thermodesulfobacteriota bacterium]|nr:alkyl sulfatase dimerization domain-containing protein [Thermodesulfobacteriota bacterium]
MRTTVLAFALLVFLFLLTGCPSSPDHQTGQSLKADIQADASLEAHSGVFKKGVEQVTENVFSAIGYGLANSIMIEGDDGLIIVDTMETREQARLVLAEFRKISAKPVKAIIYTHNHTDHIFGADVFAEGKSPDVYAHQTTHDLVNRVVGELRPATNTRGMRMFGTFLDADGLVNAGIGPFLGVGRKAVTLGYMPPTVTFSDRLEATVAGVRFELIHAPGETDDQIYVWLPDQRLLICGDNFYWTFPNLYTIRGTLFRSLKQWYRSVDIIRNLRPDHLVPCHTRPLHGADRIYEILTDYRDAIQFIHDQSIRGINMGLTPDQMVEYVKLPPHLADKPYLQPFYGTVAWSVRAVFAGNMGWFDGDAANLEPLSPKARARLMIDLAGGEANLWQHAQALLRNQEYQAALHLSGHLLQLSPDNTDYKGLRVSALTALGEKAQNPNARHYYLTEALEIRDGFVAFSPVKADPEMIARLPLANFFEALGVSLDAKASDNKNIRAVIKFADAGQAFEIHVRLGVAEINQRPIDTINSDDADIIVSADAQKWKEMLAQVRSPLMTLPTFDYEKGGLVAFAKFMKLFEPQPAKLPYEPVR